VIGRFAAVSLYRIATESLLDTVEKLDAVKEWIQPTRGHAVGAVKAGPVVYGVAFWSEDEAKGMEDPSEARWSCSMSPSVKLIGRDEGNRQTESKDAR
jgi:hypothetical protein